MGKAEAAQDPSMEEILASIRRIIAEDSAPTVKPAPQLAVVSERLDEDAEGVPATDEARPAEHDMPRPPEGTEAGFDSAIESPTAEVEPGAFPSEDSAGREETHEGRSDHGSSPRASAAAAPRPAIAEAAAKEAAPAAAEAAAPEPEKPAPSGEAEGLQQPALDAISVAIKAEQPQAESGASKDDSARLLSPRSDEAVQSAFDQLAHTILSNQARTLEDLVKEMLRPLLRDWLDDNLPVLVERLVREEIERVSRGRR